MAESVVVIRDSDNGDDHDQLQGAAISKILAASATPMHQQGKLGDGKKKTSANIRRQWLGLDEILSLEVWQASMAELLGTAVLVFMLDTVVISSFETDTKTPNIVIACFVSLVITILLLATGPISGGHINPIISFSAALVGLISFSRALVYILAQCLGATLGAIALKAVVSSTISNHFSLGACTLTVIAPGPNGPTVVGIETGQALGLEIVCTVVFLFPVVIAFDHRQLKALGPVVVCSIIGIVVGLLVFVSTTVTTKRGYSGAGINPARCIGPALIRGGHLWKGHWIFWVGPTIGCFVFYLYALIIPRQHFKPRVNEE
ncbi:hypothetical protein Cgig2_014791 [Carnegiea gigantea]|uniref:Uncharacterized protein n=1 Tax=Carnegiea gigantea TaxID=171969 RepID=A0A9Q1QRT0_9CARY|nr:hypothetical protein Cgig2_014791 [Carnegiea gigantea]